MTAYEDRLINNNQPKRGPYANTTPRGHCAYNNQPEGGLL